MGEARRFCQRHAIRNSFSQIFSAVGIGAKRQDFSAHLPIELQVFQCGERLAVLLPIAGGVQLDSPAVFRQCSEAAANLFRIGFQRYRNP